MYKYRLTTIRLDSAVEWYTKDQITESHMQERYYDTKIMTVEEDTINSSQDILIKEVTFSDIEQFYTFTTDPVVVAYIALRNAYEEEHEITRFKEVIV